MNFNLDLRIRVCVCVTDVRMHVKLTLFLSVGCVHGHTYPKEMQMIVTVKTSIKDAPNTSWNIKQRLLHALSVV